MASGRVLGIDVTIFNPKLDPEGSIPQALVEALADGLRADQGDPPMPMSPDVPAGR